MSMKRVSVNQITCEKECVLMRFINRIFTMAMFLYVFTVLAPGFAEAKTYRFYAPYPQESYITKGIFEAAEQIKKETNGEITLKVFPGMQLGGYEEAVEEVRQGTIEFAAVWLTKRYDDRLDVINLPGLIPLGQKQYVKLFFGEDQTFNNKVGGILKEMGIHSLGAWAEPLPNLFFGKGKTPKNLEDFNNKKSKIRVPAMPMYRDSYSMMGYQTLTMDLSEIWNALQTGQVDGGAGQTIEDAWIQGKDIIETYVYTRALCPPQWLLVNQDLWNSFTADQQKIITKSIAAANKRTLAAMDQKEAEYVKLMKGAGKKVVTFSDKYYIDLSARLRKEIWPKYYKLFGEEFLKDLDKKVVEMSKK